MKPRLSDKLVFRFAESGAALGAGLRGLGSSLTPRRGFRPEQILVAPQDLRVSDPTSAKDIIDGQLLFAGRQIDTGGRSPFDVIAPSEAFAQKLHGFSWLRHFRDLPVETAAPEARKLVGDWLARARSLSAGPALHNEVVARRLMSFISNSPLLLSGASPEFHKTFLAAIGRDVTRLRAALARARPGENLLLSIAQLYAALSCKGLEALITPACQQLTAALEETILPDGCHRSRNPVACVDPCFDLLPLKQALGLRERPVPREISSALSVMVRMLRTLGHRDGRLVTFNGAGPVMAADLAILHSYERAEDQHAPSTGASRYLRLDAGVTTLFLDAGTPPPPIWSGDHHFAPLALEWSHQDTRIVVSCGAPPPGLPELASFARLTAAHSTLVIEDSNAAAVEPDRPDPKPILRGARTVSLARLSSENWTLIDSSHDGYKPDFRRIHHRKIALSDDGLILAGEDSLEKVGRARPLGDAVLRFHLGPEIRASLSSSGQGVALDAGSAGIWLFSVQDAVVSIEESVIFATFRGRQRTAQLVIPMPGDERPLIWRFTKMRDHAA